MAVDAPALSPILRRFDRRRAMTLSLQAAFAMALVLAPGNWARAQEPVSFPIAPPPVSLASTERRALHSMVLARDFQVDVSLPAGYTASAKRYPVVYVTDADSRFASAQAAVREEQGDREIPEAIVVGIGYGNGAGGGPGARGSRREEEMTPTASADSPGSGEADRFLRFIREELTPFIDATYRTEPADRTLVGGSLGGLFVMYVMLRAPDAFQQYVASSPSLWWDNRVMFRLEREYAAAHRDLPVTLFTSMGADESDTMVVTWRDFLRALRSRQYRRFRLVTTTIPGAQHGVAIGSAIYPGVKTALGDMTPPTPALQAYVGRYALPEGGTLSITRDARQLWADWEGQSALKLLARAPRRFSFAAGQGRPSSTARTLERLVFQVDAHGRATAVVVYQNGRSLTATRVAGAVAPKAR